MFLADAFSPWVDKAFFAFATEAGVIAHKLATVAMHHFGTPVHICGSQPNTVGTLTTARIVL